MLHSVEALGGQAIYTPRVVSITRRSSRLMDARRRVASDNDRRGRQRPDRLGRDDRAGGEHQLEPYEPPHARRGDLEGQCLCLRDGILECATGALLARRPLLRHALVSLRLRRRTEQPGQRPRHDVTRGRTPRQEASIDSGTSSYYTDLYNYVHNRGIVVTNPGTAAASDWQLANGTADVVTVFEGTSSQFVSWTPPAWIAAQSASRLATIVGATSTTTAMQAACARAKTLDLGWSYVTPDVLPNPFDVLPTDPYWSTELTACV